MKTEDGETTLRRSALVVFQKLSLGREAQSQMIKLDVIKWTVNMLKIEGATLPDYTLEYSTALLMNLSLRSQGKRKCEELDADILKVLNELLEHENLQVRTYVNGTLYCILERRKLREEAKALGMDKALRYLSNKSEPRFQRQIKYILTHLEESKENEPEPEDDKTSEDSEDEMDELNMAEDDDAYESEMEDDFDAYEDDDDELDNVTLEGEGVEMIPRGEKWLMQEFLATNEDATYQNDILTKKIDNYNEERKRLISMYEKKRMEASMHTQDDGNDGEKPHMRPLTPNKVSSNNNTSVFEPDSSTRNLPSELKSRPKLGRTPPDDGTRSRPSNSPISRNYTSIGSPTKSDSAFPKQSPNVINNPEYAIPPFDIKNENNQDDNGVYNDNNEEQKIIPKDQQEADDKKTKENDEKLKDPEKVKELNKGFYSKDKIRRTPPREAKMRYLREKKKKMQQMPHLYN